MNFGSAFSPYGAVKTGSILKNSINWSSLLTNTQKTLGIINQAIPVFYQIRPMFNNIKTMFRVANEISRDDNINTTNNATTQTENLQTNSNNNNIRYEKANYNLNDGPNFFI